MQIFFEQPKLKRTSICVSFLAFWAMANETFLLDLLSVEWTKIGKKFRNRSIFKVCSLKKPNEKLPQSNKN